MVINTAGQAVGAQLTNASSGADFTGTVTVYVTIDAETQTIGSVGSGLCTHEGKGYHTYRPSQAETNGDIIAFTFTGTGAITRTIQFETESAAQAAAVATTTATGAVSVASLITQAAKRVNIIGAGQTIDGDDLTDMFTTLVYLMDAWQVERLTIPFLLRTVWTLTATKGTIANPYTVGSGGDIDIPRPTFVDHVSYQNTSVSPTLELPLPLYTDDAWAALPQKNLTSVYPVGAYYNPTYAGNLGSLYLVLVPSGASLQGVLYAPSAVGRFTSTADTIVLPPGYLLAIRDNLAVQLGSTWRDGLPIDPLLFASARDSKRAIKQRNVRPSDLTLDAAVTARGHLYNIWADS